MGYDIHVTTYFSTNDTINIHDFRRQIHIDLELLPNQFNLTISTRINTTQSGMSGSFYSLYGVVSEKKMENDKIITTYQMLSIKY
jgi:hypothetical protein